MVIDHKDPLIRTAEIGVVSGKVSKTELGEADIIDGNETCKRSRARKNHHSKQTLVRQRARDALGTPGPENALRFGHQYDSVRGPKDSCHGGTLSRTWAGTNPELGL